MIERTLKEIIRASGYLVVYKNDNKIRTLPVAMWGRVLFKDEDDEEWIGVEGYIAAANGVENCEEGMIKSFQGYCPTESYNVDDWR